MALSYIEVSRTWKFHIGLYFSVWSLIICNLTVTFHFLCWPRSKCSWVHEAIPTTEIWGQDNTRESHQHYLGLHHNLFDCSLEMPSPRDLVSDFVVSFRAVMHHQFSMNEVTITCNREGTKPGCHWALHIQLWLWSQIRWRVACGRWKNVWSFWLLSTNFRISNGNNPLERLQRSLHKLMMLGSCSSTHIT